MRLWRGCSWSSSRFSVLGWCSSANLGSEEVEPRMARMGGILDCGVQGGWWGTAGCRHSLGWELVGMFE